MMKLGKKGRWFSPSAMIKIDAAVKFAVMTHGLPGVEGSEVYEFNEKEASEG